MKKKNYEKTQHLSAQTKRLGNLGMTSRIITLQKIQHTFALSNHFQEAAARTHILHVFFQMLRKTLNFLSKNGNLHLRRTSIALMEGVGRDDFSFGLFVQHGNMISYLYESRKSQNTVSRVSGN